MRNDHWAIISWEMMTEPPFHEKWWLSHHFMKNDDWATISWEMMTEPPLHKKWWLNHQSMRNDDWATILWEMMTEQPFHEKWWLSYHFIKNLQHLRTLLQILWRMSSCLQGVEKHLFQPFSQNKPILWQNIGGQESRLFFLFSAALRCKSKYECWRERRMGKKRIAKKVLTTNN